MTSIAQQWLVAIGVLLTVVPNAHGQTRESPRSELEQRLDHANQYYQASYPIPGAQVAAYWLPQGERFIYRFALGPDRGSWGLVDAARRTNTPVLPRAELSRQLEAFVGHAVDVEFDPRFTLTPDGERIEFQYEGHPFALRLRDHTVEAAKPQPDGEQAPSGRWVAAERDNGFVVLDSGGREVVQQGGEENNAWQLPPQGAWSPDSRYLLVWRNDARAVHGIPIVDYAEIERLRMVPYPKVGTPLVRTALSIVNPVARTVQPVSLAADEGYDFVAGWRPDASEALILHLSRDGKRLVLYALDPTTAATRIVLHEERAESFVGGLDFGLLTWRWQVTPLSDNRRFVWMSERNGWRHAYLYDYAGHLQRQVTKGSFPVQRVLRVTPNADAMFVLAAADSAAPYDVRLYRVRIDGSDWRRLTPAPGIHDIELSPSGRYFADAHSTRGTPRVLEVRSVDGRDSLEVARADPSAFLSLAGVLPESLMVLAADQHTRLYGALYKPWDFDPRKRYPVVDYIYGGPWTDLVPWDFGGSAMSHVAGSLAQMGCIVMVLDARGTPGRGKAFQDVTYGRIGETEIPDHIAGLRQAAASRPYMDLERVGIYGHSWGGYFALRGMLTAPEFFRAGYAGAPGDLGDLALINEPYMGLKDQNAAGYQAASNLPLAGKLQGRLKMMQGTSDENAPMAGTMMMIDALTRAGKPYELLIMPGQPHVPRGALGQYYLDDVRRFFVEALGGPMGSS